MDDNGSWSGWGFEPGMPVMGPAARDSGVQELFMQTTLPQALVDPDGRFVMANRAYCDLVGYSDTELLEQTLEAITHPADVAPHRQALDDLASDRHQLVYLSSRYLRGDGVVLRCRLGLAVVRDDEGEVRYFHSAVQRVEPSDAEKQSADHDTPVVIPQSAIASSHLTRILQKLTSGRVQVALMRLEGLEDIAAVIGWGGVDRAHAQIVSRVAGTTGMGIKAIVPIGATDLLVLSDTADAGALPSVMHSALRAPVALSGFALPVSLRIGFTTGLPDDDSDTLLRQARVALNHALRSGSPEVRYEPALDAQALQDFALSIEIAHALANQEFVLHYQPQYNLHPLEPAGFEALLRWDHPDRGPVPPDRVVRLAETSGLIAPLTCWVIDTAAAQVAAWRDAGTPTRVAVNIAPSMLTNPILPLRLSQAMTRHLLPASSLELEITETALATGPHAVTAVQQLADLGYWIHVDDFGTGYSSLAAIRSLPLRAIKIDQLFVRGLVDDTRDRAVVAAIIEIAHQLGSLVIAEGVEDEITLDLLRILGCDKAQGYYLGRPLPPDEVGQHLRPASQGDVSPDHGSGET